MEVQCAICDKIETIADDSYQAKRLMNRRVQSYLCKTCYDRITEKTMKRHESGNFKLYRVKQND